MDSIPHDNVTSNVLAWTTHAANIEAVAEEEAGCDADEPPDHQIHKSPISNHFKRTPIRRDSEHHHESLLTKALLSHSEEESHDNSTFRVRRRRSITSNISLASTTDLTCETGITTPARTSSPSPQLPAAGFMPLPGKVNSDFPVAPCAANPEQQSEVPQSSEGLTVQIPGKKRCISFACAAKPKTDKTAVSQPPRPQTVQLPKPAVQDAPKRSCIKFACHSHPSKNTPPQRPTTMASTPVPKLVSISQKDVSPKRRSPSTVRSLRSSTPRRAGQSPAATRSKKYLDANLKDLQSDGSRFHEFASDELAEDDWIRRDEAYTRSKLTISDTLEKENAIRKLGKEAEEEADLELEEELDDEDNDMPGNDELEEEEEDEECDEEVDLDEDQSGYGSDDDISDGYNTDNEVGFASSDDEDDDLVLWTTHQVGQLSLSGATPVRQNSLSGHSSDSSDSSMPDVAVSRGRRTKPIIFRPGTPELPDSTDFVCGTLDEDRPLEDAYISCMAARRREKQIPIPQDIDPSFPNSEPEDEVEELYKHGQDSDDQLWLHGELEDIHHEQDRSGRRRKAGKESPKRLRSPPPRRQPSPAPKSRGRSPRRASGQTSPRRFRSPAPRQVKSPVPSLVETSDGIAFKALAFGPGLTYTKSLPKAPAIFTHNKSRKRAGTAAKVGHAHVRGAIDIVKGLEQKRQRRKEKFYQKYCNNRARKEKAYERLPPGQGAERMREVGMGRAQGNYVISF